MAILYYDNNFGDQSLTELDNWSSSDPRVGPRTQALSLPLTTDDIVILESIDSGAQNITVNNCVVDMGANKQIYSVAITANNITLSSGIVAGCELNANLVESYGDLGSYFAVNTINCDVKAHSGIVYSCIIDGDIELYGQTTLYDTAANNFTFYGHSTVGGVGLTVSSPSGYAVFNDYSVHGAQGMVSVGDFVFNDYSSTFGNITGDVVFNDNSSDFTGEFFDCNSITMNDDSSLGNNKTFGDGPLPTIDGYALKSLVLSNIPGANFYFERAERSVNGSGLLGII